ncbi:hypothetical protein PE067_20780 [Paracoccus sp. DMF-8]|uniref:hypothetical protein n=1 Tax=Paracoccus sp. DMF-8 TaxID=3019445 RepID=UPI0023E41103|nr:hypothetical protein [Paracoccus sp. DMF-8]MDF3608364.1 hypothetical protein [Paracoccus sp. DMF-8]
MRTRIEKLVEHLEEHISHIQTSCLPNPGTLLIAWEAALEADVRIGPSPTRLGL